MALIQVVKDVIWLQALLDDLGMGQELIRVKCDIMGTFHLMKNHTFHARTKHIDVQFHFVH